MMIDGCADNIKITIYLDNVLDGYIEIKAGQAENCLRITIKNNGDITHNWTKTTKALTVESEKDVRLCLPYESILSKIKL